MKEFFPLCSIEAKLKPERENKRTEVRVMTSDVCWGKKEKKKKRPSVLTEFTGEAAAIKRPCLQMVTAFGLEVKVEKNLSYSDQVIIYSPFNRGKFSQAGLGIFTLLPQQRK